MTNPQEQSETEEPIIVRDPRGPRENQNKKDDDDESITVNDDITRGLPRDGK